MVRYWLTEDPWGGQRERSSLWGQPQQCMVWPAWASVEPCAKLLCWAYLGFPQGKCLWVLHFGFQRSPAKRQTLRAFPSDFDEETPSPLLFLSKKHKTSINLLKRNQFQVLTALVPMLESGTSLLFLLSLFRFLFLVAVLISHKQFFHLVTPVCKELDMVVHAFSPSSWEA